MKAIDFAELGGLNIIINRILQVKRSDRALKASTHFPTATPAQITRHALFQTTTHFPTTKGVTGNTIPGL